MPQTIRFYTDEHVAPAIVRGLRQRGVDVVTVAEAGLLGASDEVHLQFALAEQRVIFTQDNDFLRFHAAGVVHAGLVYAPQQTAIGAIIRGLMLIYQVIVQGSQLVELPGAGHEIMFFHADRVVEAIAAVAGRAARRE